MSEHNLMHFRLLANCLMKLNIYVAKVSDLYTDILFNISSKLQEMYVNLAKFNLVDEF